MSYPDTEPKNLNTINESYIAEVGISIELGSSSGVAKVHIPSDREDIVLAFFHALTVSGDELYSRHQRKMIREVPYEQTLYDYRHGLAYPQELARPADANLAVGLRSEKEGFTTMELDNRNVFEDQERVEIPADVVQKAMANRDLAVDAAEFARLLIRVS